ncbi:uncharacterized protein LOC130644581 [Hydractinia symbiolongicarpus]|uniref:uncharacterized protein LOC130644581 n=1 Tax=Hydractinia symbiolongicarpus TaxID=13093 RepID=UPI00254EFD39|nr:uncharacterized protein LOC130644581 [Hydractinia symbiolongicarpus]
MYKVWYLLIGLITTHNTDGDNIRVSQQSGADNVMCGSASTPCKTFMYAFTHRAVENDCILIDGGGDSHHPLIYHINSSLHIKFNLTIKGTYPSPVFATNENSNGDFSLFNISSLKIVHLCFEGIYFENISLVYISTDANLSLYNSTITNNKNPLISFASRCDRFKKVYTIIKNCSFVKTGQLTTTLIDVAYTLVIQNSTFLNGSNILHLQVSSLKRKGSVEIDIRRSSFENTHSPLFLFGDTKRKHSTLKIRNCNFTNTSKTGAPLRIISIKQLIIRKSIFANNRGSSAGALLISDVRLLIITDTKFIKNRSVKFNGGAIMARHVNTAFMDKCLFIKNSAQVSGGAIYKESTVLTIRDSIFDSNSAKSAGGAIFGDANKKHLKLWNVIMYSSMKNKKVYGSLVNGGNLIMKNVKMVVRPVRGIKYVDGLIKVFGSNPGYVNNFTFICPANNKVELNNREFFYALSVTCSRCTRGSYSLDNGQVHFGNNPKLYVKQNVTCKKCPNGGMCDDNILTSQGNFWGYVTTDGDVHFIPCPPKYCCKPGKCESYNSCYKHREGRLCGRCEKGYSLDVFSHNCVLTDQTNTSIFWISFVALGFTLTYTLMYMKKILIVCKVSFCKVINLFRKCKTLKKDQSGKDDIPYLSSINNIVTSNENIPEKGFNTGTSVMGYVKNLFMFYQTASLLHVVHPVQHGFFLQIKNFFSVILTFKCLIYDNLSRLSPLNNMGTIESVLIDAGFALSLFVIVLLSYLAYLAIKRIKSIVGKNRGVLTQSTTVTFPIKLKQTFVQLLFLCYIRISNTAFKMIHCVNIQEHNYLYIHGDIACYTYWQYIVISFTIIWVFPFSVAVFVATKLYAKGQISTRTFFIVLLFPPLFLLCLKIKSTEPTGESEQDQVEQESILSVINGQFRSVIKVEEEINQRQHEKRINWEAILVVRRLVFVAVSIFVINPLSRLYLMLPLLVFVLLLHWYVKPYHSDRMNLTETVSILLLLILTTVNLFWACDYMSPLTSIAQYDSIVTALGYVEHLIYMSPFIALLLFCACGLIQKLWRCTKQCFTVQT